MSLNLCHFNELVELLRVHGVCGKALASPSYIERSRTMGKTISMTFGLAILLWLALPAATSAQRIVSLQSMAHGKGTLVVDDAEYKITGVLVVLRENGEAEFTLFT